MARWKPRSKPDAFARSSGRKPGPLQKYRLEKSELLKTSSIKNAFQFDLLEPDGSCALDLDGNWSSALCFSDINYASATEDDQRSILARYIEFLNALGNENNLQLLIQNRYLDEDDFARRILMKDRPDEHQPLREAWNGLLEAKVRTGNNRICTDKYFIYNVREEDDAKAARTMAQMDAEFIRRFSELGCRAWKLKGAQRVKLLYDVLYPETKCIFDYGSLDASLGFDDVKDCIAPTELQFFKDHFVIDGRYARVLYLKDYSSELPDELISQITALETNLTLVFNMKAMERGVDKALLQNKLAAMEAEMVSAQEKASLHGYDPNIGLSSELKHAYEEAQNLLHDVQSRNQRLFECQFLVLLNAPDRASLEALTTSVQLIAKNRTCQIEPLRLMQKEGFNACLGIGRRIPYVARTLTTSVCGIFMPFTAQELNDGGDAHYYGLNTLTRNLILCDRKRYKNPNGWYFGQPGSGKSMAAKREMLQVFLDGDEDDLIVIDPEDEYKHLAKALGGTVIDVNNKSDVHINGLDGDIREDNFVASKADFAQTFTAQISCRELDAVERSLIDRTIRSMYARYFQCLEDPRVPTKPAIPTLQTFYRELAAQPEEKARNLAVAIEMYVNGSYTLFSGQTNIGIQDRFCVYNVRDTEEIIKPVAMLVILESLWQRIIRNFYAGRRTWIWIDEIYLLFKYEYAANFLYELFKRARKYGCIITGITQNVSDLAGSATASTMLSNSEFVCMLSQSVDDKEALCSLLKVSSQQMSPVVNARPGCGVLYIGSGTVVSFEDEIDRDSPIYAIMTSSFEERAWIDGRRKRSLGLYA